MESVRPSQRPTASEAELARREAGISRVAWTAGVALTLVTSATLVLMLATGGQGVVGYAVYALLAAIPMAYIVFCNVVIRRMHISVLRHYQAQIMYEMTDLKELVYRDELTGLFNRRHFQEVIRMEVEKAHVTKQPLAVMLLDLDGLKTINDEYGHNTGDQILANLGKAVASHTRANDIAARLGGDEFGIVMPATDKRGAFALARRLWDDLEHTPFFLEGGKHLMIRVSIGLAGFPWGGERVEELLQWADADMYANKVSRKLAREGAAIVQGRQEDALSGVFPEGPLGGD